jgi:DNA repair protein RadC
MKTMVYDRSTLETLLANTLREKTDSYTVKEILKLYPTVLDLLDASEEELQLINGIGPAKARQIKAVLELGRLLSSPPKQNRYTIRSPRDAYMLLKDRIAFEKQENFMCIAMDTKNHVIGIHTITVGTLNSSLVHPREVFRPLIRQAAASFICGHNHPSGISKPSPEDITVTMRLQQVGDLMGIELLDHVIVSANEYTSLKERGYMDGGNS